MLNASPLWKEAQEPLRLADVVVVNRQEASALTGAGSPQEALERLTAPVAIVTAGADGAFLRNGAAAIIRYPAAAVTARNTAGAGDVLVGSLAGALALGLPLAAALRVAVTLAAEKVTREGVIGGFPSAGLARSVLGKRQHAESLKVTFETRRWVYCRQQLFGIARACFSARLNKALLTILRWTSTDCRCWPKRSPAHPPPLPRP